MTEYTYDGHQIEFDDSTGFPALPEGQFWRVKGGYGPELELREKFLFWSVRLDYAYSRYDIESLKAAACRVIVRGREAKAKTAFLGDYPPKKLP